MKNKTGFTALIVVLMVLFVQALSAQQRYTVRADPKNPKRNIIDLQPVVRKAGFREEKRNVLEVSRSRPAIPFKPFEMRNPKSGRALDPAAIISLKMPDGSQRKTTVKQFFEQLNAMESALAAKGRTLRVPGTFADLRPDFNSSRYTQTPRLNPGFKTITFKANPAVKSTTTAGTININPNLTFTPPNNPVVVNLVKWNADLYIGEAGSTHGNPEFPATWVKVSGSDFGRKVFPVIVQVPKGFEGLVKRIDWQVSDQPFDGTIKDINVPGIKLSGTVNPVKWANWFHGTAALPNNANSRFAAIYVDLNQVEPEPVKAVKAYYIRAIVYDQSGGMLNISPQVIASYGSLNKPFKIASPESHSVPGFNYQFPDAGSSIPFGVFIKGSGFNSYKGTKYIDENFEQLVSTGFRVSANASLGIKYFNFLSIINDQEPVSKDLTIIKGDFKAVLGNVNYYGKIEDQGVNLALTVLEGSGIPPYNIGFTQKVPGLDNTISLEYDVVQKLEMGLLDSRFFIGPVPIRITAGITGEAGIKLFGQANTSNFDISGGIKPFLSTRFDASGGVDAVIAYATLNATINPLLSLDMPMTFSSTGTSPLSFSTNLSGLAGKVYLKVGFYYPCPSLEKIIGFITGDEDLPLCECKWEYNIFEFAGFTHSYAY